MLGKQISVFLRLTTLFAHFGMAVDLVLIPHTMHRRVSFWSGVLQLEHNNIQSC
jgi:hypothetical protein